MTDAEPTLPLDLEREIFELSGRQYPTSIPSFLRVCHRVHTWLEPFLYRVMNLDWSMPSKLRGRTQGSFLSRILHWYSPPTYFFNADTQWQTITCLLRLNPTLFELSVKKYSAPAPTSPSGNRKQLPKEMRPTRLTLHCRPRRALIFRRDAPDAPEHRRARAGARVLGPLDSGAPRVPRAEASMRHVQHRAGYYSACLDRVPAPPGHRCVLVDGTHPAVSARESAGVPRVGSEGCPLYRFAEKAANVLDARCARCVGGGPRFL
ncbi:hypothetical protein B0H14DRAFT_2745128 [Mycena olivaceomarginata]|nr:hypothetical protein B0H14DRAFT_2745128 [Mycena olivaceomarginata]